MPDFRPTWATVDLDAIRHNARALAEAARPAQLLTVVKADAYGHGAIPVARAAVEAGVTWLGVALVEEGVALRDAGIDVRILLLSEPPAGAAATVVEHRLTPTVYSMHGIEALAKAQVEVEVQAADPLAVHLKVDTGMHRVGCAPDDLLALVDAIDARPELDLEGVWTHLAVADQPGNTYTDEQLDGFDTAIAELERLGRRPRLVHASNSAGTLGHPRARYDLVRCGIALYGIPPSPEMADTPEVRSVALEPALSVTSHVSHVKTLAAGTRLSYGLHYEIGGGEGQGSEGQAEHRVATVPIGYADGVPRNLGLTGGEVLIRGRRCPIAGSVTMDQLMVDVAELEIEPGDEVVLLGSQGQNQITANDWAERLGVIGYEVTTRLGPRLPRKYLGERA